MKFLKSNPDFLIIGGGIFGCAIAWNLSRRSSGSVLLLERRELASSTTPRAAGLIRNINPKQGQTALKSYTIESIGLLSEELEESLHWHQVGGLIVAESEANIKQLEDLERHAIKLRKNFCWIERTEVEDLVPWLDTSKPNKFALLPDDGFIDPVNSDIPIEEELTELGYQMYKEWHEEIRASGLSHEEYKRKVLYPHGYTVVKVKDNW